MELRVNPEAVGLGAYQAVLAIVGLIILFALAWRAFKAWVNLRSKGRPLNNKELVAVAWPPVVWLAVLAIAGVLFSTMQAYGPRVAIPKTDLTINEPDGAPGEVNDLSPETLSDEERLQQQRKLEEETKNRVDLE